MIQAVIENLASRLAAAQSGRVMPNDLIPYLPISLEMAEQHLRDMVDGQIVREVEDAEYVTFEFTEFVGLEACEPDLTKCLATGRALPKGTPQYISGPSFEQFQEALFHLAECTPWPAEAIKQHEILYITSDAEGPISVASVAGRSNMTLKRMKDELKELAKRHYAKAVLDDERGLLTYEFPDIRYSQDRYLINERFIRQHPSALKEEFESRLIKTLGVLAACLVLSLILAPMRVPLQMTLPAAFIVTCISGYRIFTRRQLMTPEKI